MSSHDLTKLLQEVETERIAIQVPQAERRKSTQGSSPYRMPSTPSSLSSSSSSSVLKRSLPQDDSSDTPVDDEDYTDNDEEEEEHEEDDDEEFTSTKQAPQRSRASRPSTARRSAPQATNNDEDQTDKATSTQCTTSNCVVCLHGAPPSFTSGTPIWAQILHLVLYALTESAKQAAPGGNPARARKYFHLRDDIYEFLVAHWDVVCRRERIRNWRHTIGMTLSHYQNLFQNGYHIFQNTGHWCLKDGVPSPYDIDAMFIESKGKRRLTRSPRSSPKAITSASSSSTSSSTTATQPRVRAGSVDMEPDENVRAVRVSPRRLSASSSAAFAAPSPARSSVDMQTIYEDDSESTSLSSSTSSSSTSISVPNTPPRVTTLYDTSDASLKRKRDEAPTQGPPVPLSPARFAQMKEEIESFNEEINLLQEDIVGLQEQVKSKKDEEELLKYLHERIGAFHESLKQRVDKLRSEMEYKHSVHQQQIVTMTSELSKIRSLGIVSMQAMPIPPAFAPAGQTGPPPYHPPHPIIMPSCDTGRNHSTELARSAHNSIELARSAHNSIELARNARNSTELSRNTRHSTELSRSASIAPQLMGAPQLVNVPHQVLSVPQVITVPAEAFGFRPVAVPLAPGMPPPPAPPAGGPYMHMQYPRLISMFPLDR